MFYAKGVKKGKKGLLLETKNTQNHENRTLGKTQAIPLKFWYQIPVPAITNRFAT